ncbi:MAG: hypothetical protein LBB88_09345 [Planctomycetaceae bacterium]|jgi:uncharacterized Zn finger protein|nr:hypothetical protein [Planctomycetaceae bacterium]
MRLQDKNQDGLVTKNHGKKIQSTINNLLNNQLTKMGYDYFGWSPYVSVANKLANAKKFVAKKLGSKAHPVKPSCSKIAKTFWGVAWCENLESYADYGNRIQRGKTYIRNGSVAHLEISTGKIKAYVAGSDTYQIEISIAPLSKNKWDIIKKKCSKEIGSVVELLQGKLSKNVLAIVTDKTNGLFPKPDEISFDCSCPDFASMCKHIAATLYGVGVMLDAEPELFFKLRGVDYLELIDSSVNFTADVKDDNTLDDESLESIFGVELSDSLGKTTTGKKDKIVTKNKKKTKTKPKVEIKTKSAEKPKSKTSKKAVISKVISTIKSKKSKVSGQKKKTVKVKIPIKKQSPIIKKIAKKIVKKNIKKIAKKTIKQSKKTTSKK